MDLYANINVALVRDPKMLAVGPYARLLYIQAILFCRENLTDGLIDAHQLPLVAVDIPQARKQMVRLVEVGALVSDPDGWRFPGDVWRQWNPSRAEVEARREGEKERKRAWRERNRDAGVPLGQARPATSPRRDRDANATGSQSHSQSHSHSDSSCTHDYPPTECPDDGTNPVDNRVRRTAVADAYAATVVARTHAPKSPEGLRTSAVRRVLADPELDRLCALFPAAPADVIAAALHGEKHSLAYYARTDDATAMA